MRQAPVLELASDEKTERLLVHGGLPGNDPKNTARSRGLDARERQPVRPGAGVESSIAPMARQRSSEKKREPTSSATSPARRVLPMELQIGDRITDERGEWRVIGRPHTTLGGKSAHVRVELVEQPNVIEVKTCGAHERIKSEASDRRGGQPMMRLTRRGSLLVAFCLLTSAATAYAECAWVMWEERPLKSGEWRLATTTVSTFETKRSCDDIAAVANRSEASRAQASEPPSLFRCLPDTIDPRGPKAK